MPNPRLDSAEVKQLKATIQTLTVQVQQLTSQNHTLSAPKQPESFFQQQTDTLTLLLMKARNWMGANCTLGELSAWMDTHPRT